MAFIAIILCLKQPVIAFTTFFPLLLAAFFIDDNFQIFVIIQQFFVSAITPIFIKFCLYFATHYVEKLRKRNLRKSNLKSCILVATTYQTMPNL